MSVAEQVVVAIGLADDMDTVYRFKRIPVSLRLISPEPLVCVGKNVVSWLVFVWRRLVVVDVQAQCLQTSYHVFHLFWLCPVSDAFYGRFGYAPESLHCFFALRG